MLPKVNDKVVFNPKFIKKIREINESEGVHTRCGFLPFEADSLIVTDIRPREHSGHITVGLSVDRQNSFGMAYEIVLTDEWYYPEADWLLDYGINDQDWRVQAFLLAKRPESVNCSCSKPRSKRVIISRMLQYDFCSKCKKEIA